MYALSWQGRRRGHHVTGAALALAGVTVVGTGSYLGGHPIAGRKVASRHPAYDTSGLSG